MNSFKDLGITASHKGFTGEKVKAAVILNIEIEVHAWKVAPSKHYAGQKCIWLQIKHRNEFRVLFLQGVKLLEVLEAAKPEHFPFKTTIVKVNNEMYEFT